MEIGNEISMRERGQAIPQGLKPDSLPIVTSDLKARPPAHTFFRKL